MNRNIIKLSTLLVSLFVFFACGGSEDSNLAKSEDSDLAKAKRIFDDITGGTDNTSSAKFTVTSNDITAGKPINVRYGKTQGGGCNVNNVGAMNESPHLAWSKTPTGTKSYVIIMVDNQGFLHWAIWDIPASASSLPRGVGVLQAPPKGVQQLQNDFGEAGYGGPCPPAATTNTYTFTVYAMKIEKLNPDPLTLTGVAKAIQGNYLGTGNLRSTFTSQ